MIDDAAGDEPVALAVEVETPRVARALGEQLENLRLGVVAPDAARELIGLAVARALYLRRVEDAVHPVEPAVGAPDEVVGQLVRVLAAEAGEQHFLRVGAV